MTTPYLDATRLLYGLSFQGRISIRQSTVPVLRKSWVGKRFTMADLFIACCGSLHNLPGLSSYNARLTLTHVVRGAPAWVRFCFLHASREISSAFWYFVVKVLLLLPFWASLHLARLVCLGRKPGPLVLTRHTSPGEWIGDTAHKLEFVSGSE